MMESPQVRTGVQSGSTSTYEAVCYKLMKSMIYLQRDMRTHMYEVECFTVVLRLVQVVFEVTWKLEVDLEQVSLYT